MSAFSQDVDLAKIEPTLFRDLAFGGQTLAAGADGTVTGTSFSDSAADFATAGVAPGHVIQLDTPDGTISGAFEIIQVLSATELTVSSVRAEPEADPVMPFSATDLAWRVATFDPQAEEVRCEVLSRLGLWPDSPESVYGAEEIMAPEVLRRASALGVLAAVFTAAARQPSHSDLYWAKARRYAESYRRAIESVCVKLDADGDGAADATRCPSQLTLRRG